MIFTFLKFSSNIQSEYQQFHILKKKYFTGWAKYLCLDLSASSCKSQWCQKTLYYKLRCLASKKLSKKTGPPYSSSPSFLLFFSTDWKDLFKRFKLLLFFRLQSKFKSNSVQTGSTAESHVLFDLRGPQQSIQSWRCSF